MGRGIRQGARQQDHPRAGSEQRAGAKARQLDEQFDRAVPGGEVARTRELLRL